MAKATQQDIDALKDFFERLVTANAALREAAMKLLIADRGLDMLRTAEKTWDMPAVLTWAPTADTRPDAMKSLAAVLDAARGQTP